MGWSVGCGWPYGGATSLPSQAEGPAGADHGVGGLAVVVEERVGGVVVLVLRAVAAQAEQPGGALMADDANSDAKPAIENVDPIP